MGGSVIPTSEIRTLNMLVASVAGTSKQKRMCGCLRRCAVRAEGRENACVVSVKDSGRNRHGQADTELLYTGRKEADRFPFTLYYKNLSLCRNT